MLIYQAMEDLKNQLISAIYDYRAASTQTLLEFSTNNLNKIINQIFSTEESKTEE